MAESAEVQHVRMQPGCQQGEMPAMVRRSAI